MMENRVELVKALPIWKTPSPSVEPLAGGITNFNYLVKDGERDHVARVALKSNTLLGLDRKKEVHNTRIAFELGVGPRIVAYFPKPNCLVVEYIQGSVLTPKEGRQAKHIKEMAQLFKKLHQGQKFQGEFNPFEMIDDYLATVRKRHGWLPSDIEKSVVTLQRIKKKVSPFTMDHPCHLDLMLENIIVTENGLKLIDWEYSTNSDPRFDLAMFSLKAELTQADDKILLDTYGAKEIPPAEFAAMKAVVHFREGAWGLVQLAVSKIPFDYKKYAMSNLEAFNLIASKVL